MRGIAIAAVLLFHFIGLRLPADGALAVEALRRLTLPGWAGVDRFFVLSGFLITSILLANRRRAGYFRVFYLRRACRILPLYFLLLGLFYLLLWWQPAPAVPLLQQPEQLDWHYWLFLQNFRIAEAGNFEPQWLGVSWSLAIEEQFYLVLPLLIWLLPPRALPPILLGAIILAPLLRWQFGPGIDAYVNTFARLDAIAWGGLLACLLRVGNWPQRLRRWRPMPWLLAGFLALATLLIVWRGARYGGVWNHSLLALSGVVAVLLAQLWQGHRLTAPLRNRGLVWLGWHSYGIYLLHGPVFGLLLGSFPGLPQLALALAAAPLSLLLAWFSFRQMEGPLIRWSHQHRYGDRRYSPG